MSAPEPDKDEAAGNRRALVAVGVFAGFTIIVLIAALLYFAARGG